MLTRLIILWFLVTSCAGGAGNQLLAASHAGEAGNQLLVTSSYFLNQRTNRQLQLFDLGLKLGGHLEFREQLLSDVKP
jgi:hypothetical protein